MKDSPTEFELITAIAFVFFKKMNCDFVVLEAGLGGRLDSTNVITTAVLSIITGIDLDHTAILGDTTAKIAAEKAGIIKHNTPVLFGEGDEDAQNIIKKTALERRCTFYRTDFSKIENIKSDLNGTSFDFGNHSVKIGLHGLYQTRNMATVCTAVEILRENGISISDKAVSEGFLSARWKARFEILNESPLIIYDGAHNPQGIAGAVENISHYLSPLTSSGRVLLLMGVMADKDFHKMISMLSPLVEQVFCVTPDNSRSLESGMVEKEFEQFNIKALSFDKLNDGVFEACRTAENKNIPLICLGSLYMYADVKKSIIKYFNL